MLQSLQIDNYALIDHLELQVKQGMTVITGETGAGKSIIMGALSMILGGRADAKTVRTGRNKCVIEASFDISRYALQSFFESNDLEYDPAATIIRREIHASGKSRAFINDTPVQLTLLKELGLSLIDIHSQHQNLLLGKDSFQQEVVDTLADNADIREQYHNLYKRLSEEKRKLQQLREEAAKNVSEQDYLRFQFDQLDAARLKDGELEELEAEQTLLSHAEEIKGGLLSVSELLDGSTQSVIQSLKQSLNTMHSLQHLLPEIGEIAGRLESDYIDLKDIADEVAGKADDVNFDPERNEAVTERLDTLYMLLKKHGKQEVSELISLRDELDKKLQHIDNSDEEIAALERIISDLTSQIRTCAASLTESRTRAARKLEKALIEKAAYLGMPKIRFEISISPTTDFTPHGADDITFLFSANKNQPLRPAGEIASGGEISRLMLAIKSLIASAKTLPTIIFDEIDTGVSGEMADRMGVVMKEMATALQVITITHLPQVAGKGDTHYKVYKADDDEATTTHLTLLDTTARVEEIARMLSGSQLTEQAMENARVLMG